MAEYDENTTDKRGWGMYLGSFFDPAFVTVNNRGKSGADTRGFYTGAAYWPAVKSQMHAGDYLLIQFAHNDEGTVTYGMDNLEYAAYCAEHSLPAPTDARGTNPQTTYRDMLRAFIDEARALGVNPVLVGPICRAYFQGNDIKRNGKHDLGDKFSKIENGVLYENQSLPAGDSAMSYVKAMKVVAAEKNVPFIDMTEATRRIYTEYGETQCLSLLFCAGDKTHTNAMGGNLIARAAADSLKSAGILAEYIHIPTDITANPNAIEIGETYCGVAQNKEFLLTGYGLEPKSGTVALRATANLQISFDKAQYASTAQASYEGGSMFQKVYVRANYTTGGEQLDTVYATTGGQVIAVPVSANAVSLDGGAAVSAFWSIHAKPVPDPVVEGPVSAAFTMSRMACIDYNASKNYFVDGDSTTIVLARFHNSADGSARTPWPAGEIDENANRYLDFAVTAPEAMDIRITRIAMEIAADGTSTMCYHINTGFGADFTNVTTIAEKRNMPSRVIEHVSLTPTLTIPAGETLHVRILPWHDYAEVKDSKYIGLRNVKIEGMAFEPDSTSTDVPETGSFLRGADLSMVTYVEDWGAVFRYHDGTPGDVFDILESYGVNLVRLRLYNAPGTAVKDGSTTYRTPVMTPAHPAGYPYAGPDDILSLAQRAREHNMAVCLTFNLSDYWSHAGMQMIPAGWSEATTHEALCDSVYAYVYRYMTRLSAQGTPPAYVSVGNETNMGMLFQTTDGTAVPYGGYMDNIAQAVQLYNRAYDAVKAVCPATQVILHHSYGHDGEIDACRWFFRTLADNGGRFDIVGGSYYPYWASVQNSADNTPAGMLTWAQAMESAFSKPVMIMETGYSWTPYRPAGRNGGDYEGQLHLNGSYNEATEDGQAAFMKQLHEALASDTNIIGYMYWDPVFVDQQVNGSWIRTCWAEKYSGSGTTWWEDGNVISNTTWFDYSGYPLKALWSEIASQDTQEGVGNVQSDKVQATKVIENGVLYLIYKGTKYNVQGQVVKR